MPDANPYKNSGVLCKLCIEYLHPQLWSLAAPCIYPIILPFTVTISSVSLSAVVSAQCRHLHSFPRFAPRLQKVSELVQSDTLLACCTDSTPFSDGLTNLPVVDVARSALVQDAVETREPCARVRLRPSQKYIPHYTLSVPKHRLLVLWSAHRRKNRSILSRLKKEIIIFFWKNFD